MATTSPGTQIIASSAEIAGATMPVSWKSSARRLISELFGTFMLTFVAAGGWVIASAAGSPNATERAVAPGLLVLAMIYTLGPVSGAHLNPAVTLAFAVRRNFPWSRVAGYVVMQMAGALLAALLLRAIFGYRAHLGVNVAHHGTGTSFTMEIILTFLLVSVILATAANDKITGHNAAVAVAGTIILCGLFAGSISGASMNPARSLGPAIAAWYWPSQWIYLAGPLIGSVLASGFAWVLRGPGTPQGRSAATGELP